MNDEFAHRTFQPNRHRLIALARGLLGTPTDAEDIVQDAYLRAHAGVPDGLVSVEAWLLTVVRNLAIDKLRRRRLEWDSQARAVHELDAVDRHAAPSTEDLAARSQDSAAALRLIADRLSPQEAAAVLLREVFDTDYADIARSAGKSEAACRQLVRRALHKLRAARPGPTRDSRDDADQQLFSLCLLAITSHSPAALHALLGSPLVMASATPAHEATSAASPHSHFTLAQVGGRFAVVLMLDGKVLCALPVGTQNELETLPCD